MIHHMDLHVHVHYATNYCLTFTTRAQLERARQAKEDAEREKKELADRLLKFERDTKKAEEGIELEFYCLQ